MVERLRAAMLSGVGRRTLKYGAIALVAMALGVGAFLHFRRDYIPQSGDTSHLDYEGYAKWAAALSGDPLNVRERSARSEADATVPNCNALRLQLADARVAADHDAGLAPRDIAVAGYFKCGREALVTAINAGPDLSDYEVDAALVDSLRQYGSNPTTRR